MIIGSYYNLFIFSFTVIYLIRWLEYKPYGTVISGTKILPFKVPLKEVSPVTKRYNTFKIRCKIYSFLEFIFYVRNCYSHEQVYELLTF